MDSEYNIFFDSGHFRKFIIEIWLCDFICDNENGETIMATAAPIDNPDYITHFLPKNLHSDFAKYLPFDNKEAMINFLNEADMQHITKFEENVYVS